MLGTVAFIGRVGNDLECKNFGDQAGRYLQISLAVKQYTKEDNEHQGTNKTNWYPITAFDRQADLLAQYCRKGDLLYVECWVKTSKRLDSDNSVEKKFLSLVIKSFEFINSRQHDQQTPSNYSQPNQQYISDTGMYNKDDEPIPFI